MTGFPETMIERARQTNILDVAQRYTRLKKDSAIAWSGPCPICRTGIDRFAVDLKKRVWSCRKCDGGKRGKIAGGDVVDLVMRAEGVGFAEAVERLTGDRWRPSKADEVNHSLGHDQGRS